MSTDKGDSRVHPKASLAAELWVEHVGKGKCGQEGHHASPTNLRSTQWMLDGVVDGYRQPICGAPDLGRQDLGGGHPHQGAVANVEHEDVNLGGKWHHCCVKSSDYHGCDYGEKTKAIATALCQVVLRTIGHLNMTMTVNIGRMINMTMTVMMILHLIRRFHCNRSNCESRAYSFSPSHQSDDDDDDDDHDNGNNDENGDDNYDDDQHVLCKWWALAYHANPLKSPVSCGALLNNQIRNNEWTQQWSWNMSDKKRDDDLQRLLVVLGLNKEIQYNTRLLYSKGLKWHFYFNRWYLRQCAFWDISQTNFYRYIYIHYTGWPKK